MVKAEVEVVVKAEVEVEVVVKAEVEVEVEVVPLPLFIDSNYQQKAIKIIIKTLSIEWWKWW